jgi:hypothetical protein
MNNIEYGQLKVDTVLAVRGQQPVPLAAVVAAIERQVRNTQAFCRRGADAQFFQPGVLFTTAGGCRRRRTNA